jgi:hypothetical protein
MYSSVHSEGLNYYIHFGNFASNFLHCLMSTGSLELFTLIMSYSDMHS